MSDRTKPSLFSTLAPGILLAATGVGAGDLLTSTLAGSEAGLGVLWAVAVGAFLKFLLTEGIARWQLATGTTVLEGWNDRLGVWVRWLFLAYLALFTLVVGGALTSACGVAGAAIFPLGDSDQSRLIWGAAHSIVGMWLVRRGSFVFFERIMSALVGVMFVTVVGTVFAIGPDWGAVAAGFVPQIPQSGSTWILAVLGGVGGTVTLLLYGYWIREQGRAGMADLRRSRLDLAVGNGVTAIFGVAVVIIGSRLQLSGSGADLASQMADQLGAAIGPAGRGVFLAGFWAAVFSSLLGVWQGVPYLFADFWEMRGGGRTENLRETRAYRWYLTAITFVPLLLIQQPVRLIQLVYGICGAAFLPLLALTLLILNSRRDWVGDRFRSGALLNAALGFTLLFFAYLAFV